MAKATADIFAFDEATVKPILYRDRGFDIDAAKITPGQYFVTPRDMMIVTVLGSCVSACIRDSKTGIGGMNHFMLPERGGTPDSPLSPSARYGAYAMEVLINQLIKLGARRNTLEAKVFGAGKVLAGMGDIGARNAQFVREYLKLEKIALLAEDLGDVHPRKVYFFPHSGRVLVKQLRSASQTIITREKAYSRSLDTSQPGGDVDLF
jgi:chemotaxis protein CheD